MKSTDELVKEITESINKGDPDLKRFIEYVKGVVVFIKLSFRLDRQIAWKMVGDFIDELEKISSYNRRSDLKLDEIAQKIMPTLQSISPEEKVEIITETADNFIKEVEEDYKKRKQRIKERSKEKV